MLKRRSSLRPLIAGIAAGLVVAIVAWVYLFAQLAVFAPPTYPTFDAAQPVAVEQSGNYRWPGTTIRVRQVDGQHFVVERRWLGMRESEVRVELTGSAWSVAEPELGPGRTAQEVLGCVVPGAAVGWLVSRGLRRRSASKRERSEIEPAETRS